MIMSVLGVVSLVLTGLACGTLFGVALANVPMFVSLPLAEYADVHQRLDRYYEPAMPILVFVSLLADIGLAVGADGAARRSAFVLAAVAMLGVTLVSQFANVPLLKSLRALDVDNVPADWLDPRLDWRRWHLVRTGLSCAGLICVAAGIAF